MFPPRVCAAVTAIALVAAPGSARAAALSENFDSGGAGWETSGLWHIQDHPENVTVSSLIGGVLTNVLPGAALPAAWNGTSAAWFGDPASGTYCVGHDAVAQHRSDGCRSAAVVGGTLTSPPFALAGASPSIEFHAWWEIAAGDFEDADLMTVEYSVDDGSTWTIAARLNPSGPPFGSLHQPYSSGGLRAPGVWRDYNVDLSPAAGSANVRIRFRFDSVGTLGQGFRGLLIDGVSVGGSEVAGSATGVVGQQVASGGAQPIGLPGSLSPPGLSTGPVLGRTVLIGPVSGTTIYTPPGSSAPLRCRHRPSSRWAPSSIHDTAPCG